MQSLFGEESALLNGYALSAGKQKTRKSRKTSGYEIKGGTLIVAIS